MDEGNNIFCESWIVYRVLYIIFICVGGIFVKDLLLGIFFVVN